MQSLHLNTAGPRSRSTCRLGTGVHDPLSAGLLLSRIGADFERLLELDAINRQPRRVRSGLDPFALRIKRRVVPDRGNRQRSTLADWFFFVIILLRLPRCA